MLQDLPGPKLRIGKLRDGIAELKPGDDVTFVCGENGADGDARRMYITWAGLADTVDAGEIMYLADGAVRLRVTATRPGDGEIDAEVEVGGAVASRQGLNIPGETAALPAVPEEDLVHVRTGERIGVDLVALSFVRRAEDVDVAAQAHAAAADRQDREAAGRPARRGDRARRRLRDGRPRRPRASRCASRRCRSSRSRYRARRRARPARDHRDADARLDGRLLAARRAPRSPTSPTRSSTAPTR